MLYLNQIVIYLIEVMLYLIKALIKAFLYSYRFSFKITIKTVHYTCSIVILIFEQTWNIKFYRRLCQTLLITFLLYFLSIEYITFKDIKSFLMNIAFFLSYYILIIIIYSLLTYYKIFAICRIFLTRYREILRRTRSEFYMCCICRIQHSVIVVMPCRHLCLCSHCSSLIMNEQRPDHRCPICRTVIADLILI